MPQLKSGSSARLNRARELRVLLIDDDIDDRRWILETVQGSDGAIVCDVADSYRVGEAAILDGNYDACLVSHRLEARSGLDLIRKVAQRASGPVILLTGGGGGESDDEAIAAGAADCFEKSRLTTEGIRRSIRYAIRMWNERVRYQTLFDDVPVGLFRSDPDGLVVEVNAAAIEMLGDLDQRPLMDVHVPGLFVETARVSQAVAAAPIGQVRLTDMEITKGDGTRIWVDVRLVPVYVTGGAVGSIEWALTEVTQRREAELRADVRAELLDQVNSAVIVTDNHGVCTLWNRHAETMYGWTAAEAVGRPISELTVLEEDASLAGEIMEQIAAVGRWEGEFTVRRKDGSSFLAHVSNAALRDERGAVIGVVGVSLDVTANKEAEVELRRNQQLVAAAFEASPIGKVIVTPDLTIVSCNPAYARLLGVPVSDVVGRNVQDFTHPDDVEATNSAMTELVLGGVDNLPLDKRYLRPDGQTVWGRLHARPIQDEHGQVTHLLGQVIDITGAKRSEGQIRFQASVLNQVHHAVTATDMTGTITYWNHRAETLFGWTETEAIGRGIAEVLFPDAGPEVLADLQHAVREHGTSDGEVTVTRKDGSTLPVWASDTLFRDTAGKPVGYVGVKVDMTDIKLAEQNAHDQTALNRTLLESVAVPIAIIDKNGHLVVANPSWEQTNPANQERGGYLPACVDELSSPGLFTELADGIDSVLSGRTDRFATEYPCDEAGHDRWFRTVVVGADNGAVISHWDITDERIATATLEDTIRAKDAFIASVSHELRTPVTAVLGLSELLRSGTVPVDDAEEYITLIADQAQEVASLVEDLLVSGRLESDTLTIQPSIIDIASETNKVVQPWIHTGRTDIEMVFTAGKTVAYADPLRVRQILRNLITNANRYGRPPVTITGTTEEDRCVVRVTDRGKGIAKDADARMFEPYARFGPVDGQPLSVGLGLHVARRLARLMDGNLAYLRNKGETTFELTLPSEPPTSINPTW